VEMEAQKSKFAIKILPSMADFAFLMPLLFLFCLLPEAI